MGRWSGRLPPAKRIPEREMGDGLSKSARDRRAGASPGQPYYKRLPDSVFVNTQHPYHQMRGERIYLAPREGPGDYRPREGYREGSGRGGRSADGRFHNVVPADHIPSGSRAPNQPAQYIPHRNGLPDQVPYVYGAPRPAWARRALDMEAIRAADAAMDGRKTRWTNPPKRQWKMRPEDAAKIGAA